MNPLDLAFRPALEQARMIRQAEISPLELTQLYLERIQQFDSTLGSYFTVVAEQALEDAKLKTERLFDGERENLPPFYGVPIGIKDLNSVANIRCTYGCKALMDNIATFDDGVTQKIRQAGFVILGKTAAPEFGSVPYTESAGFPPTRNPWNLDYTAGGSSGGAAAAVAAGLSPIAQGSDGGGSIRGPANCCGLVGIKPARGRVSSAPVGDRLSGIATNGPIARTVTDAAALLDVMSGYITGDPYWLPDPKPTFLETAQQAAQGVSPLRIAFSTTIPPVTETIDPLCQQAVMDTVALLQDLGHTLEPASPNYEGLIEPFTVVFRSAFSASELPREALTPINRWFISFADSSGDYHKAAWVMQAIARRIVAFFDQYDALLLPVYLHPPIRIGEWADLEPEALIQHITNWIAPCPPFNATGQPAIAIPTGFSPNGLPLGVQIVGRPAADATVIALSAQIEAARPWSHHRPPFVC